MGCGVRAYILSNGGATVAGLLSKISFVGGVLHQRLTIVNNKTGVQIEFQTEEGVQRDLTLSLSRWLLEEGDFVFIHAAVR